jgi:hypothetical protein
MNDDATLRKLLMAEPDGEVWAAAVHRAVESSPAEAQADLVPDDTAGSDDLGAIDDLIVDDPPERSGADIDDHDAPTWSRPSDDVDDPAALTSADADHQLHHPAGTDDGWN